MTPPAVAQAAPVFDALFHADADPWQMRTRWYERRKRALTLAVLPEAHYSEGFEPGCANGELTAALATRCTRLLACDASAAAVALAERRVALLPQVRVEQRAVPAQWPAGRFDLIVVSELGYFLASDDLDLLLLDVRRALQPGGTLLACHWRGPVDGYELDGDAVHARFGLAFGATLAHHVEDDFVLDVWSSDPRSVAQREGWAR